MPRDPNAASPWPAGDGETTRRIRAHDWAATALGPVEGWPATLKRAAEIVLGAPMASVLLWGPDYIVAAYNEGYRVILGDKPEALGRPVLQVWAEERELLAPQLSRILDGETLFFRELPMFLERGPESDECWFDYGYGPVRDEAGSVAGIIVSILETTDRVLAGRALRESGERQAFLLKLGDALRPLSDPVSIQGAACRVLGEHLRVDWAQYTELDLERGAMTNARDCYRGDLPSHVGVYHLEQFPAHAEAWRAGRSLAVADVGTDPALGDGERAGMLAASVRAALSTPLVKNGTAVAVMSALSATPRQWKADDVALLEETADRTWEAVERARAEAALRESEARFRALVTAGTYMVYRMSPDWGRMHQLDGRDVLADTTEPVEGWADLYLLPEDREHVFAAIEAAKRGKALFELEHRVRRADGGVGWVLSRAVPVLGPDGEIAEWFGAGSDVTERREAVERLREREAAHRAELERRVEERTAELERSRDLLQATMDSSMDMIQVFEAVRDERGGIVDFRWVLNNHTAESECGEVRGKSLLRRNPGVVEEGIFDAFKRVAETGEPEVAERRYAHEQFDGWFIQSVVKLGDGVATTTKEITGWKRAQEEVLRLQEEVAQAKLRESEERFRTLAEAIEDVFYITDLDRGALDYLGPAYERVWGRPAAELFADLGSFIDTLHPDDRPAFLAGKEAQARGEPVVMEYRVLRPDGSLRWVFDRSFPIRGGAGRRAAGVASDVTARKRAEEAVAASERRLRSLVEGLPQSVWRAVGEGEWTWASPQWTAYTGLSDAASRGRGWLGAVHPEDRGAVLAAWREAETEGAFRADHRVRHAGEGAYRWVQSQALPVRDDAGRAVEWLGTSTDVEELRRRHEQEILIAELQHRTRNLLTVVGGVADQTLATSASLGEFGARFDQRLAALGRAQGLLSREVAPNVAMGELVRLELAAHGMDGAGTGRVRLAGPEVALPARAVQSLALALHELMTNALKHGALGAPGGRLDISWKQRRAADGRGRLRLDWVEAGAAEGAQRAVPERRGFGLDLIEAGLSYELGADTRVEFAPGGLRCSIELPLDDVAAEVA